MPGVATLRSCPSSRRNRGPLQIGTGVRLRRNAHISGKGNWCMRLKAFGVLCAIFRQTSNCTRRNTMRVKTVRIGIKDMQTALDDFVRTAEAIERGEKVKKRTGVYFTSMEAFRKVLTVRRMDLLRLIREKKPTSLH